MAIGGHSLVGRKIAYLPVPISRRMATIASRQAAHVSGMAV